MRNVPTPMVISETTSVVLRPMRSPKWPKIRDPSGRAMNAMAKVSRLISSATVGLSFAEKKMRGK